MASVSWCRVSASVGRLRSASVFPTISSGAKPSTAVTSGEQKIKTPSGSVSQVQPGEGRALSAGPGVTAARESASVSLATAPLPVNSFSSRLCSFLLGMTHQLFRQRAILLGRAAGRGIAGDRLAEDRAFAQLGINFNRRVQHCFPKGRFDLFKNTAMHPVALVEHGDEQP